MTSNAQFDIQGTEGGGVEKAPEPIDDEDLEEPGEGEDLEEPTIDTGDATRRTEAQLIDEQHKRDKKQRPRGRPFGAKNGTGRGGPVPPASAAAAAGVPDPVRAPLPSKEGAPEVGDDPKSFPNDDALLYWPMLLAWGAKRGHGPQSFMISVRRKLIGPVDGPELKLATIPGHSVQAYGGYSASEMLLRYLVDVQHRVGGDGINGCGPAAYTLSFYWKAHGSTIRTAHLELPSYAELIEQRAQADAWADSARHAGVQDAPAAPPPPPPGAGFPGAMPTASSTSSSGPTWPGAPATPSASGDPRLYQRLGYLERVAQEADQARAENRAPRPVPEGGGAPGVTLADVQKAAGEAAAAAVTAGLAAAGIRAPTEEERFAKILASNNEALMKNILAVYGPPPGAAGAAATAPAPTPTSAADRIKESMAALKAVFSEFQTIEEAKENFRTLFVPDEHVEAPAPIIEQKPKGMFERAIGLLKDLPPGAMPAVLAGVGAALEGSPAGALLKRAADAASAAQMAAAAAPTRSPGWGKPPSAG